MDESTAFFLLGFIIALLTVRFLKGSTKSKKSALDLVVEEARKKYSEELKDWGVEHRKSMDELDQIFTQLGEALEKWEPPTPEAKLPEQSIHSPECSAQHIGQLVNVTSCSTWPDDPCRRILREISPRANSAYTFRCDTPNSEKLTGWFHAQPIPTCVKVTKKFIGAIVEVTNATEWTGSPSRRKLVAIKNGKFICECGSDETNVRWNKARPPSLNLEARAETPQSDKRLIDEKEQDKNADVPCPRGSRIIVDHRIADHRLRGIVLLVSGSERYVRHDHKFLEEWVHVDKLELEDLPKGTHVQIDKGNKRDEPRHTFWTDFDGLTGKVRENDHTSCSIDMDGPNPPHPGVGVNRLHVRVVAKLSDDHPTHNFKVGDRVYTENSRLRSDGVIRSLTGDMVAYVKWDMPRGGRLNSTIQLHLLKKKECDENSDQTLKVTKKHIGQLIQVRQHVEQKWLKRYLHHISPFGRFVCKSSGVPEIYNEAMFIDEEQPDAAPPSQNSIVIGAAVDESFIGEMIEVKNNTDDPWTPRKLIHVKKLEDPGYPYNCKVSDDSDLTINWRFARPICPKLLAKVTEEHIGQMVEVRGDINTLWVLRRLKRIENRSDNRFVCNNAHNVRLESPWNYARLVSPMELFSVNTRVMIAENCPVSAWRNKLGTVTIVSGHQRTVSIEGVDIVPVIDMSFLRLPSGAMPEPILCVDGPEDCHKCNTTCPNRTSNYDSPVTKEHIGNMVRVRNHDSESWSERELIEVAPNGFRCKLQDTPSNSSSYLWRCAQLIKDKPPFGLAPEKMKPYINQEVEVCGPNGHWHRYVLEEIDTNAKSAPFSTDPCWWSFARPISKFKMCDRMHISCDAPNHGGKCGTISQTNVGGVSGTYFVDIDEGPKGVWFNDEYLTPTNKPKYGLSTEEMKSYVGHKVEVCGHNGHWESYVLNEIDPARKNAQFRTNPCWWTYARPLRDEPRHGLNPTEMAQYVGQEIEVRGLSDTKWCPRRLERIGTGTFPFVTPGSLYWQFARPIEKIQTTEFEVGNRVRTKGRPGSTQGTIQQMVGEARAQVMWDNNSNNITVLGNLELVSDPPGCLQQNLWRHYKNKSVEVSNTGDIWITAKLIGYEGSYSSGRFFQVQQPDRFNLSWWRYVRPIKKDSHET